MNIGRFKLTPLEFGKFKLDGGAMFGVIPKVLWERYHPADEKNRIEMVMRCLLVEDGDRKILIDTGFGEGRSDKMKKIYDFRGKETEVQDVLRSNGVQPEEITDVILTHLHFDHGGGSTVNKATDPRPTFPNATYYLQQKQLDQARKRFIRDKASYFPEDFEPLIEHGVLEIKNGDWELMPGIEAIVVNGHTPGQQLPKISDGGETLLYAADLIPLASQFSVPWVMGYDLNPVATVEEKERILPQAHKEGWHFFLEHDPKYVTAKVAFDGRNFSVNLD